MSTSFQSITADPRLKKLMPAFENVPVYVVGGAVRDALLGRVVGDVDLATPLTPTEVIERCKRHNLRVIPTGLQHQTVAVLVEPETQPIEITTFRSAGMSPAGGVVASLTIEEDLQFRDFTVNAMAFEFRTETLLDPHLASADLAARVLKAVGDPRERFAEDPLRVLRLLRQACELAFEIEPVTWVEAVSAVPQLQQVAIERVRQEFERMLVSAQPDRALRLLANSGALKMFLPEVDDFRGFEQNEFHKADLFEHTLEVVATTSADLVLRLSALFHDVGKPPTLSTDEDGRRHFYLHEYVGAKLTAAILERLRFGKGTIEAVCCLVETHMRPLDAGPTGLRRLLRDTSDWFSLWRQLKQADAYACKLDASVLDPQFERFDAAIAGIFERQEMAKLRKLAISGHDLMAMGLPAGRELGVFIRRLEELVLEDPALNTREALLAKSAELLAQNG